jgi:predicted lipid-binding transport protein (Tim44 family)
MNDLILIFLGIFAAYVLFQLFNVLGRKVGFQSEDKPIIVSPEQAEAPIRIERVIESPKIANLDVLKASDAQFSESAFVDKVRETYEQVVKAFHIGDLSPVKDKLNQAVFDGFNKAIAARSQPNATILSFIDPPKADIDSIDVGSDKAQIKVRFLAELMFELPQKQHAEEPVVEEAKDTKKAKSKTKAATEEEAQDASKTHRRTAEYWTFEKPLKSANAQWVLNGVKAAKA